MEQIRSKYLKIEPPEELRLYGWQALKKQIEDHEKRRSPSIFIFSRSLIFAGLAIFILTATTGIAYASWKAAPGDILYPVKEFTEKVISNFAEDKNTQVDWKDKQDTIETASPEPEVSEKDHEEKRQEEKEEEKAYEKKETGKLDRIEKIKNDKKEEVIKTFERFEEDSKKDNSENQSHELIQTINNLKKDEEKEVKGVESKKEDIKNKISI